MQASAKQSRLLERFQIDHIPYGLDTAVFSPKPRSLAREVFGLDPDRPVILFAAESLANHRKGFDLFQAALQDIHWTVPPTLLAVGESSDIECGSIDVVTTGSIVDERLLSLVYSAADVFVMPTRAEAFGQVVLESMSCGTPVIAFDVGGIPDLVRPDSTGLLAAREDVRELRAAIERLIGDAELRSKMSYNSRQLVERQFTLEHQASSYVKLYDELVKLSGS